MGAKPLNMEEIQKVSLEILKKITLICEQQEYRYTLAFGTLIGAVRHKGFIPWDDDIDIQMPRPDYEKLIEYLEKHPIENLKLFNWKYVKNYPLGISRICDMRYRIYENNFIDCDLGIFVDIYPIDGLANTYEKAKKAYDDTDKLRANLLRLGDKKKRQIKLNNAKGYRYFISGILLRLKGLSRVQKSLETVSRSKPFDEYEYVGIPNWNWIRIVYKREWYDNLIKVPFEDGQFYITKDYDSMLKEEYGDYMQLPPIEKRVYHHGYKAYKRNEK